jgi:CRP-like cAMP-binding protein
MASVDIIAFRPGRRPTDEARHPWQGSSDQVAFRLGGEPDNRCYVLFAVGGASGGGYALDVTLSGPAGPLPGWDRREVAPAAFVGGEPVPRPFALGADRPYVLSIAPDTDLDVEVPFTGLALDVRIRLTRDREAVAVAHGRLEVYDVRHFGTLYERIVERVVKPDTERQRPGLSHAYHPWFPVLLIGSHKAELYTRALIGDVVHKRHNLSDPGWLVRVGLYLELLTGLGIFEAVRDDAGELLTAAERAALPDLRDRLNIDGWRRVWALRGIGPSATALLHKRRATLEFLHVHHEDLQHAIELAGPNPYHAQETWHRVFRDAERAVLRQTPAAFPELERLPPEVRRFVLWHRRGHLLLSRALRVPGPVPRLLGDQDGLFASACNQYRASMNRVADWAQARGLMDHAGEEAVPRQVSLLEAHMNQPSRVALLQRRDGYDSERLEVGAELPPDYEPPLADLRELLAGTALFSLLLPDELEQLARTARPLTFGPLERIIVQGQDGDSLFVVVEGAVEVMLRRNDGTEVNLGTRPRGTVLGEMSLLTGAPRSATVRAVDGALVYEIGRRQYDPILAARPELVDALEQAMEARLSAQGELLGRYDAERARDGFTRRMRRLLTSA